MSASVVHLKVFRIQKNFESSKKRVWCQLVHLHRKLLKDRRYLTVTRKYKSIGEKIPENNNFIGFRDRDLFTRRRASITNRGKLGFFIFFNNFDRNFRLAENKGWGVRCNLASNEFIQVNFNLRKIFATIRFFSDPISPSS
jgi:hypothetical protein